MNRRDFLKAAILALSALPHPPAFADPTYVYASSHGLVVVRGVDKESLLVLIRDPRQHVPGADTSLGVFLRLIPNVSDVERWSSVGPETETGASTHPLRDLARLLRGEAHPFSPAT